MPPVLLTEFTITLPIERLNSIIECMGSAPYKLVQDHIAFIEKQCKAQVAAAAEKASATSPARE